MTGRENSPPRPRTRRPANELQSLTFPHVSTTRQSLQANGGNGGFGGFLKGTPPAQNNKWPPSVASGLAPIFAPEMAFITGAA